MAKLGKSTLKGILSFASATALSRVLGLVRTVLCAKYLGGGALASAWFMAFMVPNLARRMFGEGALGTSMIPLMSRSVEHKGKAAARRELAGILGYLSIVLALLCVIVAVAAKLLLPYVSTERNIWCLQLIPVIVPYGFFICLVGAISSVLNALKVFFLPALGALLLNLAMIICLLFVCPLFPDDPQRMLKALAVAVIIAGVLQLILSLVLLHHKEMLPKFSFSAFRQLDTVRELWKMTLPGIIGASALQISFVIDRLLANYLGPQAVPALTNSDRIIYLPIGIFAVSFSQVMLARMSQEAARKELGNLCNSLIASLRVLFFICVPVALFTICFRSEIISLILMYGRFSASDAKETAYAMLFYASGIPFFASIKLVSGAFFSRRDMATPMRVSLFCICINIVLNLALMWHLRQGGIALATVISSMLNNLILLYLLKREFGNMLNCSEAVFSLIRNLAAAAVAISAVMWINTVVEVLQWLPDWGIATQIIFLGSNGIIFLALYAGCAKILRGDELNEFIDLLRRKRTN